MQNFMDTQLIHSCLNWLHVSPVHAVFQQKLFTFQLLSIKSVSYDAHFTKYSRFVARHGPLKKGLQMSGQFLVNAFSILMAPLYNVEDQSNI